MAMTSVKSPAFRFSKVAWRHWAADNSRKKNKLKNDIEFIASFRPVANFLLKLDFHLPISRHKTTIPCWFPAPCRVDAFTLTSGKQPC
jgi:hypothetical protein